MRYLQWLIGSATIVTALAAPAQAERLLLSHQDLKAFAPDNAVCSSTYQVNVLAPDAEMFSERKTDVQHLLGGLRTIMSIECPQTKNLLIIGYVKGREVYRGVASETGNWVLVDAPKPKDEQNAVPDETKADDGEPGVRGSTNDPPREAAEKNYPAAFLVLTIACLAFVFLGRLFSRWPKAEPWLMAAALAAFIPLGSRLLFWVTKGAANLHETAPGVVIAAFTIGVIWCLVKTRTSLFGGRAVSKPATERFAGASLLLMVPMAAFWLIQYRNAYEWLYNGIGLFLLVYVIVCIWWWSINLRSKNRLGGQADETPDKPEPRNSEHSAGNKIFISYRRDDSGDITGRIYDRLVLHFDKEQVFKDVDSIPLGVDFREHLNKVVGRCDVLLAVVGNEWLTAKHPDGGRRLDDAKDFVRIEIEAAMERKTPIIPVLVRGAQVPEERELPPALAAFAYRNAIAVRPDPDFHHDMDRLIAGVESHLSERSQQIPPA
jgi:hypothetical protein